MEEKKEKRKWEKIPEDERDLPRWKQTRRRQEVKEYLKASTVMKTIRWSKSHCADIIEWWNAQESPVHSLTKIIRAEIAEHGTRDYFESRGIAFFSCCGFYVDTAGIDFDDYHFCPHCGAK